MRDDFKFGDQVKTKKGWPEEGDRERTGVVVAVTGTKESEQWVVIEWDDAPKPCVNRMDIAHTHLELNKPQTEKRTTK